MDLISLLIQCTVCASGPIYTIEAQSGCGTDACAFLMCLTTSKSVQKNAASSTLFLDLERTGTDHTGVNYAVGHHKTHFPCVFDAENNALDCMCCKLALNVYFKASRVSTWIWLVMSFLQSPEQQIISIFKSTVTAIHLYGIFTWHLQLPGCVKTPGILYWAFSAFHHPCSSGLNTKSQTG